MPGRQTIFSMDADLVVQGVDRTSINKMTLSKSQARSGGDTVSNFIHSNGGEF